MQLSESETLCLELGVPLEASKVPLEQDMPPGFLGTIFPSDSSQLPSCQPGKKDRLALASYVVPTIPEAWQSVPHLGLCSTQKEGLL